MRGSVFVAATVTPAQQTGEADPRSCRASCQLVSPREMLRKSDLQEHAIAYSPGIYLRTKLVRDAAGRATIVRAANCRCGIVHNR